MSEKINATYNNGCEQKNASKTILFIGGYARTGTTMLQGIICTDNESFSVTHDCSYLPGLQDTDKL